MVISSVLEGSYCGSLTRINQLFISVIIPTLPQEEPRGHAGWAHTMGTPRLVAARGEGKHHQLAHSQPLSASARLPAHGLSHPSPSAAEVLPVGCSAGTWMPRCARQEDQGRAAGANAAPHSAQAAQVRWPTRRGHQAKERQVEYHKRGTKATVLPLDPR